MGDNMKTFVINMDSRPERLASMRDQLDRQGLPFERCRGIAGAEITAEERRRCFSPLRSLIALRKRMTPAQLGVTLSHLSIYHRIVDENLPYALVFEDDSVLQPSFPEALERVRAVLDPEKPQVFLFNNWGLKVAKDAAPGVYRVRNAWCADGYVITRAAAKLIIAKNEPVIVICDSWKRFVRWWGLELHYTVPEAVVQANDRFESDIPVAEKYGNWFLRQTLWVLDFLLILLTRR